MKKRMKTALAAVLLAAMMLMMTACGNSQEKTYEKATKLLNDGKYAEAAEKFESLGSYEDASQMTMYAKAINEAENGNFEVAFKAFAALGDYKDCAQLQAYYVAREYEYNEMYAEAIEAYKVNPLFRDSQSRIERCGERLAEKEKWLASFGGTSAAFIDKTGKMVFPVDYNGAWIFSEGLVTVGKGGKWGYIDTTGKEIVPCQYDAAADFFEGFARVKKKENGGLSIRRGWKLFPASTMMFIIFLKDLHV